MSTIAPKLEDTYLSPIPTRVLVTDSTKHRRAVAPKVSFLKNYSVPNRYVLFTGVTGLCITTCLIII